MNKEPFSLEEVHVILSETLSNILSRKISLRQAHAIIKVTHTIVKNITSIELKSRVEVLEQLLKVKR